MSFSLNIPFAHSLLSSLVSISRHSSRDARNPCADAMGTRAIVSEPRRASDTSRSSLLIYMDL